MVVQVKNHLRSYNLSRTKVTEYDLILARTGKFNSSHEQVEKMVVCLAYRHSLGIIILVAMPGKKIALHCKNQLTGKWSIQEIREIFVTLVLVRSRKYFFNSCPFFYQRTG